MKVYRFLNAIGVSKKFVYERLGIIPIGMNFFSDEEVRTVLSSLNANILEIQTNSDLGYCRSIYYVTK